MPRPGTHPSSAVLEPPRRVRDSPSLTSGGRPQLISTIRALEGWAQTAERDHPLRRAYFMAKVALECERSAPRDAPGRILQTIAAEKRRLLQIHIPILFEFCEKFVEEVATEIHVDLPAGECEAHSVLDLAFGRVRERWGRSAESLAMARPRRGRPRSIAMESLDVLCEEIVRSPLVCRRMKEHVQRVVASWASRVAQIPSKVALRGIQRVRQKSVRGR